MITTRTPWSVNLPDETLIVGPERQLVATTMQDDDDYQSNYDTRAGDAELIVKAVNLYVPALSSLREAYTALAFAFNRLHGSARTRDGELCNDFGKIRGRIERIFKNAGETL